MEYQFLLQQEAQHTIYLHIKNLDIKKRPISATADNFEVRNAKVITIKAIKKITFNLLYNKKNSLHKKIKIEQARKETFNASDD